MIMVGLQVDLLSSLRVFGKNQSFHSDRRDLTVTANAMHSRDDAATDQAVNRLLDAEFCAT
ncbi:hypothetical protein [Microbispora catharanthi]|uniref:Uncharacterized protein n=1 Tax=Microbispora catharanthi TaxID=1712871 RepID=A0A5N6C4K3_9ACTN|nr:hypothetical protein [Microbispora catharanthi]KAB8187648.1 hypothetical protein FH610_000245 [Microbispora catharanthi]